MKLRQGTEPEAEASPRSRIAGALAAGGFSSKDADKRQKEKKKEEGHEFVRDYRGLWTKAGSEIGPGCSQGQDVGSAATLEGKILTVVNRFLTTSPLVNKVKLLMVSQQSQIFFCRIFMISSVK